MEIQPLEDNLVSISETSNKRRRNTEKHAKVDRSGSRIRIPAACAHGIYKLTHELGLRSDGETVLWLLEQVRPELVQPTLPLKTTVPRLNSAKEKEDPSSSSSRPNQIISFAYPNNDCVNVNGKITALIPVDNVSVPPTAVKPESDSEPGLRFTVRATVVQASTVFYDTPATLDKAERLIAGATAYGSELIVFPEAFVGGYPRISNFVSTERSYPSNANEELQKYYASAIDVPGPEVDRLAMIANKYKVHLVMGVVEREGSTLYSTILFFDSQGQYLGKHRKLMLAVAEHKIWCQGDDSTLPLYKTPVGKIGGLTSWDNRMPLLRTELYAKGVEIYCMPTADASDVWRASMTHIAVEGGCFILSANQFCQRKDYPLQTESVLGDADRELSSESVVCAGGSVIISPSGAILAGPNYDGESLISADLDLGEITRAKLEFNGVGHSMGPDSHSPVVDYHHDQAPYESAVKVEDSWQL